MNGPERPGESARERGADFERVLWDPVHRLAVDFVGAVSLPIHSKVKYALHVLRDLSAGVQLTEHAINTEIAVLNFIVAWNAVRGSSLESDRVPFFLQAVAANLHFKHETTFGNDPRGFYQHLIRSAREAERVFRELRGRDRVLFGIKRLLAECGLTGPENHDLVVAVYRQVAPDVFRGEQLMRRQDSVRRTRLGPQAPLADAPKADAGVDAPQGAAPSPQGQAAGRSPNG